jgi:hypothetical protein
MTCEACGWGFHRDCAECQKRADELAARIRDYPEQPHKPMPQSNQERQEALRARRAMLGMTEVRGIYLHPDQHAELKAYARKLLKRSESVGTKPSEPA